MLARCVQSARRSYTTTTPAKSNATLYAGLGAIVAAGAAYYTFGSGVGAGLSPKDAKLLEDKAKKALGLAGTGIPSTAGAGALSSDEWRKFKLIEKRDYNHNAAFFVFELPKNQDSGLDVASALVTRSANDEGEFALLDSKGKLVIRPYTPVTSPNTKGQLELLVKRYPDGAMTNHIHNLKIGDQLAMKGPIPKFPWKANQFETIGMIAGGSGITPHWQIIQQIAADPEDKTEVILLFSNQTEQDILLRKEFEELQKKNPSQFSFKFVLDKPPAGWTGLQGYLTADKLREELPSKDLGDKVKIFVCGPPGQVEALAGAKKGRDQGDLGGALSELGYSQDQVFKF